MSARLQMRRTPSGLWLLPLLCLLAACGGGGARLAQTGSYSPGSMSYPEPGPPEDPWRPYIRDASSRFSVPQAWIRAVMHQESGGHEYRNGQPIESGAGAMGLMQLMPATYADLQNQYGLGSDPFEPHDNILAGTAYIRQMYHRYGAPAFLAAYNAGPQRLDDYLNRGRQLPNETVNYVASIAPHLGTEIAMSGPLAAYATGGTPDAPAMQLASYQVPAPRQGRRRSHRFNACWHDPDAAYDPDAPCQTPPAAPVAAPVLVAMATAPVAPPIGQPVSALPPPYPASNGCVRDPDAAFDAPCGQAPVRTVAWRPPSASWAASAPAYAAPMAYARPRPMPASATVPAVGSWAIQVGAYNSVEQARFATTMARQADYALLAGSQSVVQSTTPFGHGVLYRARLAGLARDTAGHACSALSGQNIPCMVVQPGG